MCATEESDQFKTCFRNEVMGSREDQIKKRSQNHVSGQPPLIASCLADRQHPEKKTSLISEAKAQSPNTFEGGWADHENVTTSMRSDAKTMSTLVEVKGDYETRQSYDEHNFDPLTFSANNGDTLADDLDQKIPARSMEMDASRGPHHIQSTEANQIERRDLVLTQEQLPKSSVSSSCNEILDDNLPSQGQLSLRGHFTEEPQSLDQRRQPLSRATTGPTLHCARIEVQPGYFAVLRTARDTRQAVKDDSARDVICFACSSLLKCVPDCLMVICPECRVISPIDVVPSDIYYPFCHGVGLGWKSPHIA